MGFRSEMEKKDQFTTLVDSALRVIGLAVLQAPSSKLVGNSPSRHLFTWFEILFLLLASCYSAGLSSYLTVPMFYPPIDTISDLIDSGMNWLADHDAWVYSLLDVPDEEIQTLASRFKVASHEKLLQMALTGKHCVAIERLPAGHSPEEPHITEEVIVKSHMMKEILYGAPTMIVMQKGSSYAFSLNMLIHRILDSGLLLFWEGEVARKFLSSRKQLALEQSRNWRQNQGDQEPKTLKMKHIKGAFFIFFIGIFVASIQFLWEYFSHLKKQKKQVILNDPGQKITEEKTRSNKRLKRKKVQLSDEPTVFW